MLLGTTLGIARHPQTAAVAPQRAGAAQHGTARAGNAQLTQAVPLPSQGDTTKTLCPVAGPLASLVASHTHGLCSVWLVSYSAAPLSTGRRFLGHTETVLGVPSSVARVRGHHIPALAHRYHAPHCFPAAGSKRLWPLVPSPLPSLSPPRTSMHLAAA